MAKKSNAGASTLNPADDAPELTDDFSATATLRDGARVVRRGRPRLAAPKELVSIRFPAATLARLRALGPGWQGVVVRAARPGVIERLDARDLVPPFTPGALRGGSHVHLFSPDGRLVSFTYEDAVLDAPPRIEGDKLYGAGAADMKSGLASVIFALKALASAWPEGRAALAARFVVVSDEEIGSPSSRALFAALAPRTTEALVFEAGRTNDRIVTRRKGGGLYTIEAGLPPATFDDTAHAVRPLHQHHAVGETIKGILHPWRNDL